MLNRILAAVLLICLTVPAGRTASLPLSDIQILGKALAFLDPPMVGRSIVAIVYRADNPESRRDAVALAAEIGGALRVGAAVLTPHVVASTELAASRFALVITALGAASEAVIEAARAQHALCVTSDLAAVRAGTCTMAIKSDREVEIFVNRAAAGEAGLSFATAFLIMVHEL